MEERKKLRRDLKRYSAMLRRTSDAEAASAIDDMISQTRMRLDEIDRSNLAQPYCGDAHGGDPVIGTNPVEKA